MFSFLIVNPYVKKFLNSFKELENEYLNYEKIFSRDILSPEWRKLISCIFTSIVAISNFMDEFREKRFKENLEEFNPYAFYWDLLLSKIKHSFATEIPRKPFYLPTILLYEKIPILGEKLAIYETVPERIPVIFLKFYMRLFLTYDFVFYKNEGVFTRFKLSEEFFNYIKKEVFEKNFNDSDSNSLKNFLKDLIIRYIKSSLKFWIKDNNIEEKKVYKKFLDVYKEGHKVFFEPFTYFLAFKMWKYGKLLQTTFEFCDVKERKKFYTDFIQKLKEYKYKQLETIDWFYKNKITNEDLLKEIFELDRNFLEEQVFTEVLAPYNVLNDNQFNFLCAKIKKIFNLPFQSQNEKDIIPSSQNKKGVEEKGDLKNNLKNIFVNYLISNEEYDKFKWERLLINGSASEINLMLSALRKMLPVSSCQYIGILRAGGLLAHCLNIMTNLNKLWKYPVGLFSSFPYISLLPRDINVLKNQDLEKIPLIIVDESIKSSFTFSVLRSYLRRNFNKFKIQREVKGLLCLADIEGFERYSISQFQPKIISLADFSIEDAQLKLKRLNISENISEEELFNWKSFIESLPEKPLELFEEIKTYLKCSIKNKKRLNITHVLSNSILLFSAAKYLANKLRDLNSRSLGFYYTTDEGKILKDTIMFVMKFLWNDIKFAVIKEKEDWEKFRTVHEDSILIFTDMTADTMHTFLRSLKMDFGIDELENVFKQLNMRIATIFASEEAQRKLGTHLLCLGKLRN